MSDLPDKYGFLINKDAKLHRQWFKEFAKLHGICMTYYAPRNGKIFNVQGDLETNYEEPIPVFGIFQDHPDQKSLKKMGWVAELQESSSIIHVPYDLPSLQVGALFSIPSGIDTAVDRIFRVISMQNIMIYPASVSCEIAPEYEDTTARSTSEDFTYNNFTKLLDNDGDD